MENGPRAKTALVFCPPLPGFCDKDTQTPGCTRGYFPVAPAGAAKATRFSRHGPALPPAFTLLEVMLAVAILTLVSAAIFRFTETTLTATRIAVQNGESTQAVAGFARLLQAQLDSLPGSGVGAVTGGSRKDGDTARDDVTLVCDAPAALLSRRAPGPWRLQLALREGPDPAKGSTLGMQRLGPADDPTAVDVNAPAGPLLLTDTATRRKAREEAGEWIPLLENVAGFEVNYFNGRLNGWLPKWNDPNALPDLLRVRLTFAEGAGRPLEMVFRVPQRTRQQALAALPAGNPAGGGSGGQTPPTPPRQPPPPPPPGASRKFLGVMNSPKTFPGGWRGPSRRWVREAPEISGACSAPNGARDRAIHHERAVALILVLWALFLLTLVVFALVQQVDQQMFLDSRGNAEREARALAFSGLQIALHPGITNNAPAVLRGGPDKRHEYAAQIRGEGGKLNLGWLIQGEAPARLDTLRRYLEGRGLGFSERETFVDALLDWVDPDDLSRANGAETDLQGRKAPNRPLADLGELRRIKGAGPLLELPEWDRDFTLLTNANPLVDLRWASEEVLAALPGVGGVRARTFVELRRGPDGVDGTTDDRELKNVDEALALLGMPQGGAANDPIKQFVVLNSPVYRIVAEGHVGDVHRTIEVVVVKNNGQGQILQWHER